MLWSSCPPSYSGCVDGTVPCFMIMLLQPVIGGIPSQNVMEFVFEDSGFKPLISLVEGVQYIGQIILEGYDTFDFVIPPLIAGQDVVINYVKAPLTPHHQEFTWTQLCQMHRYTSMETSYLELLLQSR